jgi:hypothetical protein
MKKMKWSLIGAVLGQFAVFLFAAELRATVVDPATVPGMQLRLDARAITGLNHGDPVALWLDTSGNDRHAAQINSASRPTYRTNEFAGQPAVRFDGVNDWLTNTTFVSGAQTWFLVYRQNALPASGNFQAILSLATPTTGPFSDVLLMNASGYRNISLLMDYPGSSGSSVGFSPTLDAEKHILAFTYSGAGNTTPGNYQLAYDTNAQPVLSSGAFGHVAVFAGAVGNRSSDNANHPFHGDIAEIIIYDSVLSASDFDGIQQYLYGKWIPEPSVAWLVGLGALWLWRRR